MKPARFKSGLIIGAVLGLAPGAQGASLLFDQVVQARDLICELRADTGQGGPGTPGRGRRRAAAELMVFIENVNAATHEARLVSTGSVGARAVQIYAGDTGVHFVEDVSNSVKVTSLLSCQFWKNGPKGRKCLRYEAVNSWHFDTSVHRNADQAFQRLPTSSYKGWCEPWHMD